MKYRVWNAVNRPPDVKLENWCRNYISVYSPASGYEVITTLQSQQATDVLVMTSEFGLEYFSVDGWKEWYDDGGFDVLERFETEVREQEPVPV